MRFHLISSALLGAFCSQAVAEPAPRSLDQALTQTLALGKANGCGAAFGLAQFEGDGNQEDLDNFLLAERAAKRLGPELTAICGSSAVASAASLGGSLGSLQTTKTVSQFRMARSRADSRLNARGKRAGLEAPDPFAQALQVADRVEPSSAFTAATQPDADTGVGVFIQVAHERRDRLNTPLEAGYGARINEMVIGVDVATREDQVAGLWLGHRGASAHYRATSPLIGGGNAGFAASFDASTQAALCKVGAGGGFDDAGLRLGGFAAQRMGAAFADVGLQYSRRNYAYQRNVCAIEGVGGAITPDANSESGFSSDGFPIDDVYAGTLSGKAKLTEWGVSGRVGFDFQNDNFQWGPRASLTYLHTALGAYSETGRTSVTNTVRSNPSDAPRIVTTRTAASPTGLELAFDAQSRSSLQSEVQVVAAWRLGSRWGTWVPRASASWVHEFKGERQLVTVRMVQDMRASPTRFTFTSDAADKDKGNLAFGLSLQRAPGFSADVEVTRLVGDNRFDATTYSAQARWRF